MSSSEAMEDLEPGVCAAQHAGAGARGDRGGVGRLLAPRPCVCTRWGVLWGELTMSPYTTTAFYDEPPQPNQREWPAGALLPDTGVVRKWAWRTLQAAKEELQLAVESVMEDLEGLGATSCSLSSGQTHPASV